MSKSLGNVIDASQLLEKYPVDLIRFYFMWKSSPIEPLNFDTEELMSRPYQVLSTLYHLHLYFKQNSDYDKFDSSKYTIKWTKDQKLLAPSDVWLLSKLQRLVTNVTQSNEKCRFHEAARALDDFIINSLSQVYIPITRGELWEEDETKKDRRFAIYAVLSAVLITLDVLMHPFSPFGSEYLYLCVFKKMQSVLLESWHAPDQKLVNEKIEESFDLLKETISVSAAARMKGKLKRRWPLNEAVICVKKNQRQQLESLSELLVAQLNVENYKIVEIEHFEGLELLKELKSASLPVIAKIALDRKKIGPKAKHELPGVMQQFEKTSPDEIVDALLKENHYTFDINGTKIKLERDDFVFDFDVKEGFAFSKRGDLLVIISTVRNREMMARGLVKDLARRLQTLRKERGYNPTDVLNIASILDLD